MGRSARLVLMSLLASACVERAEPVTWTAPMDGRTALPLDAPLVLAGATLGFPAEYPAPALIRVIDLEDGGEVPGTLDADGDRLHFVPNAPWRPDRRYVWTVDAPGAVPHGPEVDLPTRLLGAAVFDTSDRLRAVDAARGPDDRSCFVLSRTLDDATPLPAHVTLNDVALPVTHLLPLPREAWVVGVADQVPIEVDVACLPPTQIVFEGALLRVALDDEGPWLVTQRETSVLEATLHRHRAAHDGSTP